MFFLNLIVWVMMVSLITCYVSGSDSSAQGISWVQHLKEAEFHLHPPDNIIIISRITNSHPKAPHAGCCDNPDIC